MVEPLDRFFMMANSQAALSVTTPAGENFTAEDAEIAEGEVWSSASSALSAVNLRTKPYRWLLFDADGTLFDFERAETSALAATFAQFDLPLAPDLQDTYRKINHQCWQALERGELTPETLQTRRFELLFAAEGITADVAAFGAAYLENLARAADLLDGAVKLLAALRDRYRFAIITNGLAAVQHGRLARSAIRDDIAALIISEEVGSAKPAPGIFDAAFAAMGGPAKAEVLMIGDSLTSDIQGACDYGIDACWFNPGSQPRPAHLPITCEISRLGELIELLGKD